MKIGNIPLNGCNEKVSERYRQSQELEQQLKSGDGDLTTALRTIQANQDRVNITLNSQYCVEEEDTRKRAEGVIRGIEDYLEGYVNAQDGKSLGKFILRLRDQSQVQVRHEAMIALERAHLRVKSNEGNNQTFNSLGLSESELLSLYHKYKDEPVWMKIARNSLAFIVQAILADKGALPNDMVPDYLLLDSHTMYLVTMQAIGRGHAVTHEGVLALINALGGVPMMLHATPAKASGAQNDAMESALAEVLDCAVNEILVTHTRNAYYMTQMRLHLVGVSYLAGNYANDSSHVTPVACNMTNALYTVVNNTNYFKPENWELLCDKLSDIRGLYVACLSGESTDEKVMSDQQDSDDSDFQQWPPLQKKNNNHKSGGGNKHSSTSPNKQGEKHKTVQGAKQSFMNLPTEGERTETDCSEADTPKGKPYTSAEYVKALKEV